MAKESKEKNASIARIEGLTSDQQKDWHTHIKEGKDKIGGRVTLVEGTQGQLSSGASTRLIESSDDDE